MTSNQTLNFNQPPPTLTRQETTGPNQAQNTNPQNDLLYSQLLERILLTLHPDTFIINPNINDQTQNPIYDILQNIMNIPAPGLMRQEGTVLHHRAAVTPQYPSITSEMQAAELITDVFESDVTGEDTNTTTGPTSPRDQ